MKIKIMRISKARILINKACDSAFLSKRALIGATRLNTNLKTKESKNNMMMVGKTNNNPFNNVLIKNDFDHNLSVETISSFCKNVSFFIEFGSDVILE
jgi:hypothetical protein